MLLHAGVPVSGSASVAASVGRWLTASSFASPGGTSAANCCGNSFWST
jgi:hypothetical protein